MKRNLLIGDSIRYSHLKVWIRWLVCKGLHQRDWVTFSPEYYCGFNGITCSSCGNTYPLKPVEQKGK